MMYRFTALALGLILLATGCGSDNPAGPLGGTGNMSARVDGDNWVSVMEHAVVSGNLIAVAGSDAAARALGIAWADEGIGSYVIGPGTNANGNFSVGSALWTAGAHQGGGTINVTARTESRVAGNFTLTLEPVPNTDATGTRTVTQGTFDVSF
jgi:hypothetical protein